VLKREKAKDSADIAGILKGCSLGNIKAQEQLFRLFFGYAMSVALRFSSCRDDALEITNDSFLKVFTKIEMQNSEKEFRAWFRKIVVNTAIDHYRKNRKNEQELPVEEAFNQAADDSVIDKLNAEEIIKLINSLPMVLRYSFTLYEIEGFTHEEIGEMLGIPAGTSRSNLSRAKKQLRQMILTRYSYA